MADQVSPPTSSHGEERRFIQPLDNAEAERVNRIREMRLKNENVSTYRAKGLSWFSVFSIIANRMIGEWSNCDLTTWRLTDQRHWHI